tara:strand:+ start:40493 stop:42046 length:1554 start_codon:yes stop_codon:yes gene_type:complete
MYTGPDVIDIDLPRVRAVNKHNLNQQGDYVLYWMTSARRYHYNAALERAIDLAKGLSKPLLVIECISIRHQFSSERILTFVVQGMVDNNIIFRENKLTYMPWIENHKESGDGMLRKLSERAAVVIVDDYPTYVPRWVMERAGESCKVRVEAVDSNGIIPMRFADKAHTTAYSFRKHMQRNLLDALTTIPSEDPMKEIDENLEMNNEYLSKLISDLDLEFPPLEWIWRVAEGGIIGKKAMEPLEIDHQVESVSIMRGGFYEALSRMEKFIGNKLDRYTEGRNDPDNPAVSGLSPWLHFGHISSFRIVKSIFDKENWNYDNTCFEDMGKGSRTGWWGLSESSENFLDQIITWRELGFNFAHFRRDHNTLDSIPNWAKKTLNEHLGDERTRYSFDEIESANTQDEVWNAAQRQLLRTGHMHNYLRMLWGKRILEWSPNPETAADWMIRINDRWALDGRDPNSYTGIFWVLGRHDRAWGPERPIFGKVRYMSSANTKKKLKLDNYLIRWAEDSPHPRQIPR